jgi:hypothetical protein
MTVPQFGPGPIERIRVVGSSSKSISSAQLTEPDEQIPGIRLSDITLRLRPRHIAPRPAWTYEPQVPVRRGRG